MKTTKKRNKSLCRQIHAYEDVSRSKEKSGGAYQASEERRIRCFFFDRWSKLDAKRNSLPSYRIVPSSPALFMSVEGTYI